MMLKPVAVSATYFLVATFTVVGNPFAASTNVAIPLWGILLTLPWSLVVPRIISSLTAALEVAAIVNATVIYVIVRRVNAAQG
jgi:hypothetical protein